MNEQQIKVMNTSKRIPVYEITVDTVDNGRKKVLSLTPGRHRVPSIHGRGDYEADNPVGYITLEEPA